MSQDLSLTDIEAWIVEAADTAKRLPRVGHKPLKSCMPEVLREAQDEWEHALERGGRFRDMVVQLGPPSSAAIDRFDEVMLWLSGLSADQVRLLWARANGEKWRILCARLGCSRGTAHNRYTVAVVQIWTNLQKAKKDLNSLNRNLKLTA